MVAVQVVETIVIDTIFGLYIKSIRIHSALCIFLNNAGLHGPIFIIFIPRRLLLPWCSSRFCSESVEALTKKLAVLP